jgi:hypothetical protein
VIAVNAFFGRITYTLDQIRWALAVADDVPVVAFDARDRTSVRDALVTVLDRALNRAIARQTAEV